MKTTRRTINELHDAARRATEELFATIQDAPTITLAEAVRFVEDEGDVYFKLTQEGREKMDYFGSVPLYIFQDRGEILIRIGRDDRPLPEDLSATGRIIFNNYHKDVVLMRLSEARNAAIAGLEGK